MKKIFLLLTILIPSLLWAQESTTNYLEGAVPVENGYVTFSHIYKVPSMSKDKLYKALHMWAVEKFKTSDTFPHNKLVSEDEKEGTIGAIGEEFITFSSSFLALDRTRFYYQFRASCTDGQCKVQIDHLRYWYEENRDGGTRYNAEELITDEYGLNKKKTKLARVVGKFRRETIDFKNDLFKEIENALRTNLTKKEEPVVPKDTVKVKTITPKKIVPQETNESTIKL